MIKDRIIKIITEILKVIKITEEIKEMIKEYYLDGIEIFAIKLFSLFVLIRLFLQWYVNYFGINGSVVIANLENEYPEKLALIFGSFAIITALHYTWRRKKSRTIFAFEIFSVVSFFALLFLPQWRVAHFGINDPVEIADLENKYRATIAQIIGGFAIIIGLYNTWQRLTIAENNLKVSQDNLKVVQEGQITERFTRAIDQLGNKKMEIRLGGIYALERISTESKKDYWPIMEILTAYVRKNSNSKTIEFEIYKYQSGRRSGIIEYEISKAKEDISLDIQAILIVIGRRENPSNNEEPNHLNLQATFLQGAQLEKAHFDKADLYKAHLECAHLEGANLKRANLLCAHLDKADLRYAHLEWAKLYNADLRGADLRGAYFDDMTGCIGANFRAASLDNAHLKGVTLSSVDLRGAGFYNADLQGVNLENAYLQGADLEYAHLEGAKLYNADLEGARFDNAYLEGAYLGGAKNLTIDQLSKVKTLYDAKLGEELLIPLKKDYPELFEPPDNGKSIIFER